MISEDGSGEGSGAPGMMDGEGVMLDYEAALADDVCDDIDPIDRYPLIFPHKTLIVLY